MRHAAVLKVLERNGLEGGPGGPVFHLTVFNSYDLADGCRLTLGYLELPDRDDPRTENRPLSEAYITSNSVRINITLTNALTLTNAP